MARSARLSIRDIARRFRGTAEARAVCDSLSAGGSVTAAGLWGAADALVLAALPDRPDAVLVVTPNEEKAVDLCEDLGAFFDGPGDARVFPAFDTFNDSGGLIDFEILARRLLLLQRLLDRDAPKFVAASVAAVLQPVPGVEMLANARRRVCRGDRLQPVEFARELSAAGFKRTTMVEAPGEFSARGGILDVFPLSREAPYRVELFDDEVDSIRQFEPGTQRSVGVVDAFHLTLLPSEELARPGGGTGLLDYFAPDAPLVVSEEREVREWVRKVDARRAGPGLTRRLSRLLGRGKSRPRLHLTSRPATSVKDSVKFPVLSVSGSAKGLDELEEILEAVLERNRLVLLFANNDAEVGRLRAVLREAEFEGADRVELRVGRLSGSFQLPDLSLAFLSHDEVFDRYRLRRPPRRPSAVPVDDFVDLRPGDHVVHLGHGIGKYRGLERIVKRGETEEFLKVEFADSVLVYVPVTKASLVQKYVGARDFKPRLSKVGGVTWQKQKDRVAEAVKDLAAELLEIQAVRAAKPGIAFPPDDRMMREFEASFLYEDTPDQIDACGTIKADMQRPRPMDRLLCGDVGYGKTELAIRGAFKAVLAGKQVAVLVPTTVLAQQHYQTFTDRLIDYPVIVEMISRFRSRKEQKEIVARAAHGGVDVLIGTHRLLSADVNFADLGLIIVDEEQRFGVEHKTRLRHLRRTVDVLTMTATPIPRTLHMALLGIKDISTLSTPPPGRQAIRTEVVEFDRGMIRTAIHREMNRGGQVFFVHNRVHSIENMAKKIEGIVPEARIEIAHGQMPERGLERVMLRFIRGEVDVLVTTTIIESGLDIPNANTIFLDRADRFGLAEIHQLRGRVGRYMNRAFCYLIVPQRRLSNVAEKRIRAVEEFQELGAGFRIAMRDLEIRGAGNILGPQQSGHIAAVGYELYCQLLDEAVQVLKEERTEERTDPYVELEVGALLPEDYVPDDRQRIEVYRQFARAKDEEQILAAVAMAEDRFGPMPEPALLLAEVARVRILAGKLRVEHLVRAAPDRVALRPSDAGTLFQALQPIRDRVRVIDTRTVHLLLEDSAEDGRELLDDLKRALGGSTV